MNQLNQLWRKVFDSRFFVPGIFILAFTILYLPYILKGGFIIDDWAQAISAFHSKGFFHFLKSQFPFWSFRPLAPIFLSVTGGLFGIHPAGYIITTLIFWLASLLIIGNVLKHYLGRVFSLLFIALASTPIIASTVIFSPVMQITATASFFLFSLALLCLHKFLLSSKNKFYILTYVFALSALLTYEIVLPFFVLLFFLPLLARSDAFSIKDISKKYLLRYGLPLISVLITILLYQKVVLPLFVESFSRFSPAANLLSALHVIVNFFYVSCVAPLLLFWQALQYSYQQFIPLLSSLFVVIFMIIFWGVSLRYKEDRPYTNKSNILYILLLTLGANIVLLLLAGASPSTATYDNRGLSATWVASALVLAYIGSAYKKRILTIIVVVIIGLSWLAFIGERNSYIDSYKLQLAIVADVISKAHIASVPAGATVLGNVPKSPPDAFNQEDLFNNPWDFGVALALYSNGYIAEGDTLTHKKIYDKQIEVTSTKVTLDGYYVVGYKNLWLYNYAPNMTNSSIERITGEKEMMQKLSYIETNYSLEGHQTWYEGNLDCLRKKKATGDIHISSLASCFLK